MTNKVILDDKIF